MIFLRSHIYFDFILIANIFTILSPIPCPPKLIFSLTYLLKIIFVSFIFSPFEINFKTQSSKIIFIVEATDEYFIAFEILLSTSRSNSILLIFTKTLLATSSFSSLFCVFAISSKYFTLSFKNSSKLNFSILYLIFDFVCKKSYLHMSFSRFL